MHCTYELRERIREGESYNALSSPLHLPRQADNHIPINRANRTCLERETHICRMQTHNDDHLNIKGSNCLIIYLSSTCTDCTLGHSDINFYNS